MADGYEQYTVFKVENTPGMTREDHIKNVKGVIDFKAAYPETPVGLVYNSQLMGCSGFLEVAANDTPENLLTNIENSRATIEENQVAVKTHRLRIDRNILPLGR